MPTLVLDQNMPEAVVSWLSDQLPGWAISHVKELGLEGKPHEVIFRWAQHHQAIIATHDEDFADAPRLITAYPLEENV